MAALGCAGLRSDDDACKRAGIQFANRNRMMDVALSILALIAGGLALELFAAARPAIDFREPRGFPLGVNAVEVAEEFQIGNPS